MWQRRGIGAGADSAGSLFRRRRAQILEGARLGVRAVAKSSGLPHPRACQIRGAAKSSELPHPRDCQILAAAKEKLGG